MNRLLLIILMTNFLGLYAQQRPYHELHDQILSDINSAQKVSQHPFFRPFESEILGMRSCLKKAEKAWSDGGIKTNKVYLKTLRRCEKRVEKYDGHYVSALRQATATEDLELFQALIESDARILQKERWLEKSLKFYEKHRETAPFEAAEKLLSEKESEAMYRQMAALEMENYEADVKVLSYAQAKKSRNKKGKLRTFFVGYKRERGNTVLIAENHNAYPVTLLVKLDKVKNYSVDRSLPYHVEVDPHSKLKVMSLRPKNFEKKSYVRWSYSWVMGREDVHHDSSYRYGLPFKLGSRVIISQGFNGKATHSGRSRYAVDFVADEGTPIYAARGGKVIATEASFDQGGFDKSFGKYANYITIEHTDHTMGKYYHLLQGGVKVKVGAYVTKGQFIGLSGNTGYTSGPHLHFGVYKVESDYRTTTTVPFSFVTNRGIVDAPKKGDVFKVVR